MLWELTNCLDLAEMREKKSRGEINLSRLLGRCQEIANTSSDLGQEWRLPKFLSSCEDLLAALPKAPDPAGETARLYAWLQEGMLLQLALYFRGLLSIEERLVKMTSKCSL